MKRGDIEALRWLDYNEKRDKEPSGFQIANDLCESVSEHGTHPKFALCTRVRELGNW